MIDYTTETRTIHILTDANERLEFSTFTELADHIDDKYGTLSAEHVQLSQLLRWDTNDRRITKGMTDPRDPNEIEALKERVAKVNARLATA